MAVFAMVQVQWVLHTKWIKHLNNVLIFSVTDLSE